MLSQFINMVCLQSHLQHHADHSYKYIVPQCTSYTVLAQHALALPYWGYAGALLLRIGIAELPAWYGHVSTWCWFTCLIVWQIFYFDAGSWGPCISNQGIMLRSDVGL